jgi:hypothetical protein
LQGAEENSIDHGEDGGVGADAEGESEDGNGGEGGIAGEDAQGVAEIVQESVHFFLEDWVMDYQTRVRVRRFLREPDTY